MAAKTTIDLSCPRGCFELEVAGLHASRNDVDFLRGVLTGEPSPCPNCGASIRGVPDA